jgi:hypothetical protein
MKILHLISLITMFPLLISAQGMNWTRLMEQYADHNIFRSYKNPVHKFQDVNTGLLLDQTGKSNALFHPGHNHFIYKKESENSEISGTMMLGAIAGGLLGYWLGSKYTEAYGSKGFTEGDFLFEGMRAGFWWLDKSSHSVYEIPVYDGYFRNNLDYYLWKTTENQKK